MTWREAVPWFDFLSDSMPDESESKSTSDDDGDPLSCKVGSDGMKGSTASVNLEAAIEPSRQDRKSWIEL